MEQSIIERRAPAPSDPRTGKRHPAPTAAPTAGASDPACFFDPSLAGFTTRWLAPSRIVDLLRRSPHAAPRIREYRSRMLAGDRFPPIAVLPVAGRFLVADGHKRLAAYRDLTEGRSAPRPRSAIPVEVWTLRRWLVDQRRQARKNLRLQRRLLTGLVLRPRESAQIASSVLAHWWRVACSLGGLLGRAAAARR